MCIPRAPLKVLAVSVLGGESVLSIFGQKAPICTPRAPLKVLVVSVLGAETQYAYPGHLFISGSGGGNRSDTGTFCQSHYRGHLFFQSQRPEHLLSMCIPRALSLLGSLPRAPFQKKSEVSKEAGGYVSSYCDSTQKVLGVSTLAQKVLGVNTLGSKGARGKHLGLKRCSG